jgi:protein-disulfide isomerase
MATLKVPVTQNDHIQGNNDAPVTLVEYGDYQCPFCGRAYYIIKELQKEYGSQLRFVFRNFPLSEMHPLAEPAAEVAEFAGAHGRFWEMHDGLYENQDSLGLPLFVELTDDLGLPETGLRGALADHQFLPKIRADFLGGVRSGVNGTPTFFINGIRHEGSYEYEDLAADIDARLARESKAA